MLVRDWKTPMRTLGIYEWSHWIPRPPSELCGIKRVLHQGKKSRDDEEITYPGNFKSSISSIGFISEANSYIDPFSQQDADRTILGEWGTW